MKQSMSEYLTALIEEKGKYVDEEISGIEFGGGFVVGSTYADLIDFIDGMPQYHDAIRTTLVKIDFLNGDVFHYLRHLAKGMVEATVGA